MSLRMTPRIAKRPAPPQPKPDVTEHARASFIAGAEAAPSLIVPASILDAKAPKKDKHLLRFQSERMWDDIDRARQKGAVSVSRNTWILQAIAEKLRHELGE